MTADERILERAALVPDEIVLVDERGREITELTPWRPDFAAKVFIARRSIQWKQSIDTTIERLIIQAIREYAKGPRASGG